MLSAIFTAFPPSVLKKLDGFKELLEALLPYSDRHLQRTSTLLRGSYFVDYVINSMALMEAEAEPVGSGEESEEEDEDEDEPTPKRRRGAAAV
jgi:hypothetical protein